MRIFWARGHYPHLFQRTNRGPSKEVTRADSQEVEG